MESGRRHVLRGETTVFLFGFSRLYGSMVLSSVDGRMYAILVDRAEQAERLPVSELESLFKSVRERLAEHGFELKKFVAELTREGDVSGAVLFAASPRALHRLWLKRSKLDGKWEVEDNVYAVYPARVRALVEARDYPALTDDPIYSGRQLLLVDLNRNVPPAVAGGFEDAVEQGIRLALEHEQDLERRFGAFVRLLMPPFAALALGRGLLPRLEVEQANPVMAPVLLSLIASVYAPVGTLSEEVGITTLADIARTVYLGIEPFWLSAALYGATYWFDASYLAVSALRALEQELPVEVRAREYQILVGGERLSRLLEQYTSEEEADSVEKALLEYATSHLPTLASAQSVMDIGKHLRNPGMYIALPSGRGAHALIYRLGDDMRLALQDDSPYPMHDPIGWSVKALDKWYVPPVLVVRLPMPLQRPLLLTVAARTVVKVEPAVLTVAYDEVPRPYSFLEWRRQRLDVYRLGWVKRGLSEGVRVEPAGVEEREEVADEGTTRA